MGKHLPTREQIEAICEVDSLEALRDDLEAEIAKIEVDLDFRDGSDEWAARARGALVAHNICYGQVTRQLHRVLKAGKQPIASGPSVERITAKAAKAEAVAARLSAEAENRRALVEQAAQKHRSRALDVIERTNWLAQFHAAAAKALSEGQYDAIARGADARTKRAVSAEVVPPDPASPRHSQTADDKPGSAQNPSSKELDQ